MNSQNHQIIKLLPVEENVQNKQSQDSDIPLLPQLPSAIIVQNNGQVKPIQAKVNRGFQSNLYFIKQYCIALCQFIKDNHKRLQQFKNNIVNPLQFNLPGLLLSYRTDIEGLPCANYNSYLNNYECPYIKRKWINQAISLKSFQQFNFSYDKLKCNKVQDCPPVDRILQGIFVKSIYEALNESLNYQRPGSINGKPLPWMNQSKHLKNYKNKKITEKNQIKPIGQLQQIDQIFGVAIARVIQWGSCICGFIPDTIDLQNTQIDQQYVIHLRQTRMALFLQKMLLQEQAQLNNTEMYQTQVLLNAGQKVFSELIDQVDLYYHILKQQQYQIYHIRLYIFKNINNPKKIISIFNFIKNTRQIIQQFLSKEMEIS